MTKTKKLSPTQQWMRDNPRDKPCPKDPTAAQAWRRKRGLDNRGRTERARYEAAMREARLDATVEELKTMVTDPHDDEGQMIRDAIEDCFLAIQRSHDLAWREAAHRLIVYAVDALHLNSGLDGVEGELIAARTTVDDALAELRDARH